MPVRRHVWIRGRVQGVWFRESTRRLAREVGVGGWVRNLPDGRVEALFEGEEAEVAVLVEFVHRGPARARVEGVEVVEEPIDAACSRFEVR